jgi:D-3-phosphoglycerate dehydrogenase
MDCAVRSESTIKHQIKKEMKRVTGVGGIFFKANDPAKIRDWYKNHLGMDDMQEWGFVFKWKELEKPNALAPASTSWSPFKSDTKHFSPSEKQFMFNYRVENLVELLKALKEEGVQIIGDIEEYPYGKFGWIMDPEGNKIELWEPKDDGF